MQLPVLILLLLLYLLTSCAANTPKNYVLPHERGSLNKIIFSVDKPLDTVWQALLYHAPRKFFTASNIRKDSGSLTMSFGNNKADLYVDCGEIYDANMKFKKPFLADLKLAGKVDLQGTIYLSVEPVGGNKTTITFNTGYVLNIEDNKSSKQTWSFETNSNQKKQFGALMITCRSTIYAENNMVSIINSIRSRH